VGVKLMNVKPINFSVHRKILFVFLTLISLLLYFIPDLASATATDSTSMVTGVEAYMSTTNPTISFAGIYNSGSCVPAPSCPSGSSPEIIVSPGSVSGTYTQPPTCGNANDPTTCSSVASTLAPVESFTAFARGGVSGSGTTTAVSSDPAITPSDCALISIPAALACIAPTPADPGGTKYWRVCLSVYTASGPVDPNAVHASSPTPDNSFSQGVLMGTIAAYTRCVPNNGVDSPIGTPINNFTYNSGNHS
jgi:hypothetical protein